ncbi:hypothetical protein ACLSU7_03330 [Bdellovibrio sp. HCB185ZH]|uniref:aldose epimerase family protein n=1 Tax=Bdellovibrio sp. HCB185ZH TaxID=3394235 RepID=UPI0039A7514E
MPICEISSDEVTVKVSTLGAELLVLSRRGQSHNWIWPGRDPWKRHAPILFPIVGRLSGDKLRYEGNDYLMNQHGFARDSEFSIVRKFDDSVELSLMFNETSLEQYPFRYCLTVTYKIIGAELLINFSVQNFDKQTMLFNIGWHPAFCIPSAFNERLVQLTHQSTLKKSFALRDGLVDLMQQQTYSGNNLTLDQGLFANDALLFLNQSPGVLVLSKTVGSPMLQINCGNANHLGVWTKDIDGFICVEPWWGYADVVGFEGEFGEKKGIQLLSSGATWSDSVCIEIF